MISTDYTKQRKIVLNAKFHLTADYCRQVKKFVFVEQVTEWTEQDNEIFGFVMPNTVTSWKFYFDVLTTEFGAINLAGKKLIQNWKNI